MRTAAAVLLSLAIAGTAAATTFTVTTTADSGAGSLRQAILDADASFGNDDIAFAIPGGGVHTIVLGSALPAITQPVILDGYSQPGSSPNTQPVGQGLNAVLNIEIDGTNVVSEPCLQVFAGNDDLLVMEIQGLVINRCPVGAIHVGPGGDGALITGNYLGTDPSGASVPGPQGFGVRVQNVAHVSIGGTLAFERNLISGHTDAGIVTDVGAFLAVRGNLIGTNAAGDAAATDLPGNGLRLDIAASVVVGGADPAARNVISGIAGTGVIVTNADASGAITGNFIGTDVTGTHAVGNYVGISIVSASPDVTNNVIAGCAQEGIDLDFSSSRILGNFIGTDLTASLHLGNRRGGIYALENNGHVVVGGTGPGEANVIAHNGDPTALILFIGGVHVRSPIVEIRGNRIFDNFPLGIDLLNGRIGGAVTANDPGDTDEGPNGSQNFPIITNVIIQTGATQIAGHLDSTPSTSFAVDFFSSPQCAFRPSGFRQGENYLGSAVVTTDGSGIATFVKTVPVEIGADEEITATATDPLGRTSEFSQRLILSIDPKSGPAEGGTPVAITGMEFDAGTTVFAGGNPLTDVQVVDYGSLTAVMPALEPGTVYDVTLAGTPLPSGWLSDFLDVPAAHPFHDYVVRVATNAVSAGTGAGYFGVDNPTTRQQMAVFIMKAKRGSCYVPPPCTGIFADVPCASPFAPWVEALANEGITSGCGGGNFCPQSPVRRDQMAVFLLKGLVGPEYVPPACTGIFTDVPCPSPFADWIEILYDAGITGGCGPGLYCPNNGVTRGQMAVFVGKTFRIF